MLAALPLVLVKGQKMKWRASVQGTTGTVAHFVGQIIDDVPVAITQISEPSMVEIWEEPEGVFLVRFDSLGGPLADTWHRNLRRGQTTSGF